MYAVCMYADDNEVACTFIQVTDSVNKDLPTIRVYTFLMLKMYVQVLGIGFKMITYERYVLIT